MINVKYIYSKSSNENMKMFDNALYQYRLNKKNIKKTFLHKFFEIRFNVRLLDDKEIELINLRRSFILNRIPIEILVKNI